MNVITPDDLLSQEMNKKYEKIISSTETRVIILSYYMTKIFYWYSGYS